MRSTHGGGLGVSAIGGGTSGLCAEGKEPEAIALLLEEYKALRAEAVQRVANRMQMVGVLGVVAAILSVSGAVSLTSVNVYVAVGVAGLGTFWMRHNNRAVQRIGRQLRLVEERIDRLASRAYGAHDALLTWERTRQSQREQLDGVKRRAGLMSGWTLD
jgi:hypothetical protein